MVNRVEVFAAIRRDARVEGMSIRALAEKHGVHRRTVRQALEGAEPPPRKTPVRMSPRLAPFKSAIDEMLTCDLDAPRKQRHTARRVHVRLIEEHAATNLSYSTVRDYVRVRRAQIDLAAGRRNEVMVPQEHAPAAEAEVDFGEVYVILAGVKTKCRMFTFRLSYSGKAIHRVYATEGQEAFLEGHIDAFNEIGGIPTRHIRYDNLTSAVSKVVVARGHDPARDRVENSRWLLFRSHYGFDAFYCQPGIAGAHEKGGVEGEVGRFRRTHLVPMPVVDSLDELNEKIREWDLADERRRINDRIRTVADDFAQERQLLAPVPVEGFEPGLILTPRVDRSSLITVRMARYSVPARFIHRRVRVSLRASEVVVFDPDKSGRTQIARHPRVVTKGGQCVDLDHYLEVLKGKPGALPGSTALAQARASGVFTAAHEAFWANARRRLGDADGTRELIDVLLLHRHLPAAAVEAGLTAAISVGATSADVVALEARLHLAKTDAIAVVEHAGAVGGAGSGRHLVAQRHLDEQQDVARDVVAEARRRKVVSLTERLLLDPAAVIAGLPPDTRPLPSVEKYDQLLRLRTGTDNHPAPPTEQARPARPALSVEETP
ncbi:transposase [Nocardioides phosphati]|uniref:Transposase n=1 Tax=Nocardioides phosphati TaxID=1867775 RepID=A0ABQ2NDA8_9ACTN|nr:IS21 family transposase [Nocardioides phosphati]GGO91611.1 transposase [Nocardioides phosphati]